MVPFGDKEDELGYVCGKIYSLEEMRNLVSSWVVIEDGSLNDGIPYDNLGNTSSNQTMINLVTSTTSSKVEQIETTQSIIYITVVILVLSVLIGTTVVVIRKRKIND